ncbi:MAG TPA: 4'-phosphopantetheinyl transferase superfamily protein [Rhizobium sp.]
MPPYQVVLTVGDAVAVLVRPVSGGRSERDEAAGSALRDLTRRDDLEIRRRPSDRPILPPPYNELGVSLSHREDLLLAGFSPVGAVGVDIEVEAAGDFDPIAFAADHFSRSEAAAIAALDTGMAKDVCYRLWVAKEAALKISGRGIFDGMDEPDLAGQIPLIRTDGASLHLKAGSRLPAMALSVIRLMGLAEQPVYCALARDISRA